MLLETLVDHPIANADHVCNREIVNCLMSFAGITANRAIPLDGPIANSVGLFRRGVFQKVFHNVCQEFCVCCQKCRQGVSGQRGLARGNHFMPEIETSFMHPFLYLPLRRRGTSFFGCIWALLVVNPLPTPFSEPLILKGYSIPG